MRHRRLSLIAAAFACGPAIWAVADNTTPPIDGGNNDAANLNPVGIEPNMHHSFIRDSNHDLAFTDVGYAETVAPFVKTNDNGVQYGSADFVMAQCFSGGFLNDIAGQNFSYTFASASGYNEPAFSFDTTGTNTNPNFNGTIDNFTRAWNEGASAPIKNGNAQSTMLNIFNAANIGKAVPDPVTNAPVAVARDPFSRPTTDLAGAEERPQYNGTNAAANDRTLVDDPNGAREWAILVAWDTPDPRHALNIDLIYNTLITVDHVPASHITVLYPENSPLVVQTPDGSGGTIYQLPNAFPNAPGNVGTPVPINANNTQSNFIEALYGGYSSDTNKPKAGDKLFVYNTGHGGHTALMDAGTVGSFHTPPPPPGPTFEPNDDPPPNTDVRYKIPVNAIVKGGQSYGGFGVPGKPTFGRSISQGDGEYSSIGGIPSNLPGGNDPTGNAGQPGFDRMELIMRPGTSITNPGYNDAPVQVRLNGDDLNLQALPAPAAPQFNCDAILTGGAYVYYTVDFQSSLFVPDPGLDPDNIVIDLLNIKGTQLSPNLLYAIDLIGGDQESLFVIVPEPAMFGLLIIGLGAGVIRRRRAAI